MATKNLGKVFMTPKGQWDKTLSYTKLDIVTNKIGKISSGYIATTDIPKNTAISDAKWLKLFDLVDGDVTDEYKALQKDVTNKATTVDTNKKAVDTIYTAIQKYRWDNFEHEILFEDLSKESADRIEKILIQTFRTQNPDYGYNIQNGGTFGNTAPPEDLTGKQFGRLTVIGRDFSNDK